MICAICVHGFDFAHHGVCGKRKAAFESGRNSTV